MYTLVLQSFGRENEYKRAILTILSFYAHTSPVKWPVILFTDRPEFFEPFVQELPVRYVPLSSEKIRDMRGKIDFLHRMKIAVIEEAFALMEGNMLYADSDTFFTSDPTPLMAQVTEGRASMHLFEYQFEELRSWKLPMARTFIDFLNLIETKTFNWSNGQELIVTPQHSSWNAGVMMFHASHKQFIPDVYHLTDQFYPLSQNHASEQYAFSVVLQERTELFPCELVIYHYWYRVKKQIVDQFLGEKLAGNWSRLAPEQKLKEIKEYTQTLPRYFKEHVWTKKDNAIQAFNEDDLAKGYQWTLKTLMMQPFKNSELLKDAFYHTKRYIKSRI